MFTEVLLADQTVLDFAAIINYDSLRQVMTDNFRFDPESYGAGPSSQFVPITGPSLDDDQDSFRWTRISYEASDNNEEQICLPPPRSGAASVVLKDKLYIFGGFGGGTGRLDDFYSFDFASSTWQQVQPLGEEKPGCRENNGVVISDSSSDIILFGGYNGRRWLNDLWSFDITTKRWTCLQESLDTSDQSVNSETHFPASLSSAAEGPQIGGEDEALRSQNCVVLSNKRPSSRFGYVSLIHNHKFILWGGFDGTRWLNDMYIFDFESLTWSETRQLGTIPSRRSCPAWAKDDKFVYLHGGYDGEERKDE